MRNALARTHAPAIDDADSGLLRSFEIHLNGDGYEAATKAHYLGATREFKRFCQEEGLPSLAKVRREHVELWMGHLRNSISSRGTPYSSATISNRFKGLLPFYAWLEEEGEIRTNPMAKIRRPVLDETRKDIVSVDVLGQAFAFLEKKRRWRDCAMLAVLYDTYMRASELAECLLENVNIETGLILIPKTKNHKMRTVRLSPQSVRYLDRYLRRPRSAPEYLLNGHQGRMTGNGIYQAVRHIFEEIGMKPLIGPHDLRHTAASHVVGKMTETEMMTLFGWQKPDMARHYAAQALEGAALKAHERVAQMDNLPTSKRKR